MPKVSKKSATKGGEHGPVTERSEELDGYSAQFLVFHQDIDATPLMQGLKDNRCQCPHWGYVVKGRITMRFADREENYETGDAFYAPPGHIPVSHEPGTEIIQFSPTHELHETSAAIMRNMQSKR